MRRIAHASTVTLAVAVLAGCGGGSGGGDHATTTARAASTATARTAPAAETAPKTDPPADPATATAVRAVVERYLRALIAHDYETACATRVPAERTQMARLGGSCPKAFKLAFRDKDTSKLTDTRVTGVRRRGGYALASFVVGGRAETGDDAMVARRVGGRWLLVDRNPRALVAQPKLTRATARAIRDVTNRYLRAMAAKRWAAACATRTPRDRKSLADFSGSGCGDALQVLARQVGDVKTMRAGKVTLEHPGVATVAVSESLNGERFSVESQNARLIGGRWLLEDSSNNYSLP